MITARRPAAVRGNEWPNLAIEPADRFMPRHPVSVIVTYFEAPEALTLTLAALEGQSYPLGEVGPSKLVTLYRQCAVFVFPSNVETFGNPLVEAMACGAPIASSGTAAMPEVLGDAALYFDPADIDGMAAAIERLQRDRKLRTQLSKKAIERSRHYSWDATVARTLDVIREVAPPV